jgi:hypothetical protein
VATPQNFRVLQLEGQNYDGGNTNAQLITFPNTPLPVNAALSQPLINSVGYTTTDFTALQQVFNSTLTATVGEVVLRNQSPYWISITYNANGGVTAMPPSSSTPATVSLKVAIPPYGLWVVAFNNLLGITALAGGHYLDGAQPVPPTTTTLYADVVYWA